MFISWPPCLFPPGGTTTTTTSPSRRRCTPSRPERTSESQSFSPTRQKRDAERERERKKGGGGKSDSRKAKTRGQVSSRNFGDGANGADTSPPLPVFSIRLAGPATAQRGNAIASQRAGRDATRAGWQGPQGPRTPRPRRRALSLIPSMASPPPKPARQARRRPPVARAPEVGGTPGRQG